MSLNEKLTHWSTAKDTAHRDFGQDTDDVAVYAVNSKIMYSVMAFCCSCCALHEAVARSVYMTYL
jgi:hypothetical protein